MTDIPNLKLLAGKETQAKYRHPWVFSGALADTPEGVENGSVIRLLDSSGRTVGTGTYSSRSSIAVRIFEFGEAVLDKDWFAKRFREADEHRQAIGFAPGATTDGYRLIFGEADGVPGLVVDRYRDVLVIQISTAGMDRLRDAAVAALIEVFRPRAVVERSDLPVRKEEGLSDVVAVRFGEDPGLAPFSENGWNFLADVMNGQKTGFFLDQKQLRRRAADLSAGRTTLNLFSYSGAAGIAAAKGGAVSVHNVDSSDPALELCRKHAELNGVAAERFTVEAADVFQYLAADRGPSFDLVLVDPPALIKSRRDAEEGKKAYHFLNRAALRLVRDGGFFFTSSCSRFLPEDDLAYVLRRASLQAGVRLAVVEVVRQAADHPQSLYFPEASYLKSFICRVRR